MRFASLPSAIRAVSLAAALSVAAMPAALAAPPTVVTPTTSSWISHEQATATGDFVTGPGTPPSGTGSYKMTTGAGVGTGPGSGGKAWLSTNVHNGTKLADISSFSYATYVDPASTAAAHLTISVQLQIDLHGDGTRDTTMVYEPVYSPSQGAVVKGAWQTWNLAAGNWWFTTATSFGAPQAVFPSFADIKAAYPNATIVQSLAGAPGAGVQLVGGQNSAGAPWSGFIGAVDNLTIGAATYNFEPYAVAEDGDGCKNGGWETLRRADGSPFKNQGDCVSYTNNGR
jgi:hypothetical protein